MFSISYNPTLSVTRHQLTITIIVSGLPQFLHMTELDIIKENRLHSIIRVVPFFCSIVRLGFAREA